MKILISVASEDKFELVIKDQFTKLLKMTDKKKLDAIYGEDENTFINSQEIVTVEEADVKGNVVEIWPAMDLFEGPMSKVKVQMQAAFDSWANQFKQDPTKANAKVQKSLESLQKKYGSSPNSVVLDPSGTSCEVSVGYAMYDPKTGNTSVLESMIRDSADLKPLKVSVKSYNTKSGHKVIQVVYKHDLTATLASLNSRIKAADAVLTKLGALYLEAVHLTGMFEAKSKALKTPPLTFTFDETATGWTLDAIYPFDNWPENKATTTFTRYMSDNIEKAKHVKLFNIHQRFGNLVGYVMGHNAKIKFI